MIILNYGLHMCGVSRALVNFANAMADSGYDVTIKIETNNFELKNLLSSKVKVSLFFNEPKFFGLRIKGFLKVYHMIMRFLGKLPAFVLHKMIVKNKYDVEISFNRGMSAKIISGSRNKYSKKYIWVHSDYMKCLNPIAGFKTQQEATRAYLKYDKIICVSEQSKVAFMQKYDIHSNVIVCNNIFDENQIKLHAYQHSEMILKKPMIVAIGRLSKEKAYDLLLRTCKKLNDRGCIYDLYILGDGEEKEKLLELKDTLELSNVHFVGLKLNPYTYLNNADIYVSSSIYEGLSTTTIEAMILGIPIIVTDCTGMRDILCDGKYGIITDIDSESLYSGISKLLHDDELRRKYADLSRKRGEYYYKDITVKRILEEIGD